MADILANRQASAGKALVHAKKRGVHERFVPEHVHCFPGRHPDVPAPAAQAPRADFPDTGTPGSILHRDDTSLEIERDEPSR